MSELRLQVDSETELRLIEKDNAPKFLELINRNRMYLRQWLGWLDATRTISDLERFIESCRHQYSEKTGFSCLIWHQDAIVGIVHLRECDASNKKAMIGYWVGEEYRGRAFAKKATRAIVDYAFKELNLNRIEIRCATDNFASQAIPKSLGFKKDGTLRDNQWLYDHFVDHIVFSVLAGEWETRRDALPTRILELHHGQVSIPKGDESKAREFYCTFLGLSEIEKPEPLISRGGLWVQLENKQVHFGAEENVDRKATKAHLAYLVSNLSEWRKRITERDIEVLDGIPIPGYQRFEFRDPFGNRVEFLERQRHNLRGEA